MPNTNQPITLSDFPRAILHVDGDAFFTSVEQAIHPHMKGKPVVSGKERGIIACASYEAKALGIKRGISLWDARKICPDLVVLPSDYETYSIFSKRMFEIMRRYTPEVEEYSIDEGFADITGMDQVFRKSYEEIALDMQRTIEAELGLTVSIGLSLTKSLAKIASDFRKPNGLTAVRGKHIHLFLQRVPLADVWGFGPSTQERLRKLGLQTAYDFVRHTEKWAQRMLNKPGVERWHELRGTSLWPVKTAERPPQASLSKGKTFSAPSVDREFIYAKLMRNAESAFIKLRRYAQMTEELSVSLRNKDYQERGLCVRLTRSVNAVQEVAPFIQALFERLYVPGAEYRATTIVLNRLTSDRARQYDLFEDTVRAEKIREIANLTDRVNQRFGKHKLSTGTALLLPANSENDRDEPTWRRTHLLSGETARQRIYIPRLDIKI
jgi:DNA polymerase-4/DNA polymerase V